MSFQIIGDSCCDYPYLTDDYTWIKRVPLTIELGGEVYTDNAQLRCAMLVSKMAASRSAPKSACPSPGNYLEAYTCGADDIYVVTLSDKLSGSYESAVVAANMFKEAHPAKNIFVFSSKSAASGEIAVCRKILSLAEAGEPFERVVAETLDFISGIATYFILETLDVFRKNGRLSHLQSLVTGALRLKLIMGGDETGNICIRGKALSMDRAISRMAELIAERCKGRDMSETVFYITHCQCPDRARLARDKLMEKVAFKDCVLLRAGGISTIYANAGGFVLAY
ncbi:MAG: DegV family EDD domain-containing protein [Oscillospiraceae bacterium]|nr:DegV family EDD domain-containing protein [Oscillospiraceae bacterium]